RTSTRTWPRSRRASAATSAVAARTRASSPPCRRPPRTSRSAAMPRIKTKVGFRGHIKEIEVEVPDNEPAPWGADAQLKIVGTDVPRIDGVLKATGRAKYTYDKHPKGMLWGKILHSPWGAATIKSLDLTAAKIMPGFRAVHVFKEVGRPLRYHGDE